MVERRRERSLLSRVKCIVGVTPPEDMDSTSRNTSAGTEASSYPICASGFQSLHRHSHTKIWVSFALWRNAARVRTSLMYFLYRASPVLLTFISPRMNDVSSPGLKLYTTLLLRFLPYLMLLGRRTSTVQAWLQPLVSPRVLPREGEVGIGVAQSRISFLHFVIHTQTTPPRGAKGWKER